MKSVLILLPYEYIYPPMNGGMQRCFNIIVQLARRYNLTLLIAQGKEDFLRSATDYPELKNVELCSSRDYQPVRDVFNLLPERLQDALRYRWYKKQLNGPADSLFLQYYPLLVQLLEQKKFDSIILENLASLNAVSVIRKFDKQVNIIYDAHNVDSHLAQVAVDKWAMPERTKLGIMVEESNLYKTVDAILTCSEEDKIAFLAMNKEALPAAVIPNGVLVRDELNDRGVQLDIPGYIIFCGTLGSDPNVEGLDWFYRHCWDGIRNIFPLLQLLVVGSGAIPHSLKKLQEDPTVVFSGPVDDVRDWYDKAALSIVPLLSGSGTRLKILEAMSLGLPVVSTAKGAEGIAYEQNKNILIADDPKNFTEAIVSLLQNKEKRIKQQAAARALVKEKYDWDEIGGTLHQFLNGLK